MKDEPWELLPKDSAVPTDEPRATVSHKKRIVAAFVVAVVSDILSAWLEFLPQVQWTLDILTAGFLFLLLGRQWAILPALIAEAIPRSRRVSLLGARSPFRRHLGKDQSVGEEILAFMILVAKRKASKPSKPSKVR